MTRQDGTRAGLVAASLVGITAAYNSVPIQYELASRVAQYLFFLPIVMAALWFGLWGGVVVAALSTACYLPRAFLAFSGPTSYTVEQYGEALDLLLVGSVLGFLAERERATNRQLQESQAHLRRAERMSAIGQLAANLAHEIRNPLASIEGAADLLKPGTLPEAAQEEFVDIIKKESRRLNRLLTRLLDYARQRPPAYIPASVPDLLRSVVDLLGVVAEKSSIRITMNCDPHLPRLQCDPEQIKQVLVNLVMNAIQAMPGGGQIGVSAFARGHRTTIEVADQGAGLDSGDVETLFSPFYTTKKDGTGLGLAIAQHIVTQHEGQILVRNNSPHGAVFSVELPSRPHMEAH